MKRIPRALALTVGAALALTAAIAVSPSYAVTAPRTLPAGQTMYAISCYQNGDGPDKQLLSVDAATAVSTRVGTGFGTVAVGTCAYQPAWDANTQKAYFIDHDSGDLVTMNTTTGVSTVVAPFTLGATFPFIVALAISPTGIGYAIETDGTLYSVDLVTAALTLIGPTGQSIYASAFNSAGTLYGMDIHGVLYSVNTGTGGTIKVTTLSLPSPTDPAVSYTHPYSMQFDSAGILWVENDAIEYTVAGVPNAYLWSVDLTAADPSASAVSSGAFTDNGNYYYHGALLIVPFAMPVFTSAAEAAGTVGSAFTFAVTATGPDAPTFAVTTGALPAGLTLNPTTGAITGTPTAVGTSTFTITATNRVGSTPQSFTLNIAADASIHLPVVSG